jgi:hypothetical protein
MSAATFDRIAGPNHHDRKSISAMCLVRHAARQLLRLGLSFAFFSPHSARLPRCYRVNRSAQGPSILLPLFNVTTGLRLRRMLPSGWMGPAQHDGVFVTTAIRDARGRSADIASVCSAGCDGEG